MLIDEGKSGPAGPVEEESDSQALMDVNDSEQNGAASSTDDASTPDQGVEAEGQDSISVDEPYLPDPQVGALCCCVVVVVVGFWFHGDLDAGLQPLHEARRKGTYVYMHEVRRCWCAAQRSMRGTDSTPLCLLLSPFRVPTTLRIMPERTPFCTTATER